MNKSKDWATKQTVSIFGVDNIKLENDFIFLLCQKEIGVLSSEDITTEIDKKIKSLFKKANYENKVSEFDFYSNENGVLINKYDIQDTHNLNMIEAMISAEAMHNILMNETPTIYDKEIVERYHTMLFGRIYSWAGEFRRLNIVKNETHFEIYQNIEIKLVNLFQKIKETFFLKELEREDVIKEVAYFLGELNRIHPFREGNGRTQRLIVTQLLLNAGYEIKWSGISDSAMKNACIDFSDGNINTMVKLIKVYIDKL